MSRRSRRRAEEAGRPAGARPEHADRQPNRTEDGFLSKLGPQLVFLAALFAAAVLLAELFGAANLGVAFGVGQIAFALAVVYLILKR